MIISKKVPYSVVSIIYDLTIGSKPPNGIPSTLLYFNFRNFEKYYWVAENIISVSGARHWHYVSFLPQKTFYISFWLQKLTKKTSFFGARNWHYGRAELERLIYLVLPCSCNKSKMLTSFLLLFFHNRSKLCLIHQLSSS